MTAWQPTRVALKGTVPSIREALRRIAVAGDAALVRRGALRWLVICCPCGCGDKLPINLDKRVGPAWKMYLTKGQRLTLYPSVWRESACGSHFIVWAGSAFIFRHLYDSFESVTYPIRVEPIPEENVRSALSKGAMKHFSKIADELGAVPWDVLHACRKLVQNGSIREGEGDASGYFSLP